MRWIPVRSGAAGELVTRLVDGGAHNLLVQGARETTVTCPVDATAFTEVTPSRAEISSETAPSQCPQVMPVTW